MYKPPNNIDESGAIRNASSKGMVLQRRLPGILRIFKLAFQAPIPKPSAPRVLPLSPRVLPRPPPTIEYGPEELRSACCLAHAPYTFLIGIISSTTALVEIQADISSGFLPFLISSTGKMFFRVSYSDRKNVRNVEGFTKCMVQTLY